jgi:glycosyltransferase involved in cell wall biosynthesis
MLKSANVVNEGLTISSRPLVSVIMNCYNSQQYLSEAIESVLSQTYSNWEIIFWDNQSNDGSAEIFKSYADDRMKYFYAPQHTTLGQARNLAFAKANGEWCGILDCDDIWLPQKLEKQLDSYSINKDIGVIYSDYNIIGSDGQIKKGSGKLSEIYEGYVFKEIFAEEFTVCWPTVLFNICAIREVGLFSTYKYLEDLDILIRLSEKYRFIFVNEKLASYRVHPNQSSVNYGSMLSEKLDIYEKWESIWNNQGALTASNKALLARAKARAFSVAGKNAVYYGDSGVKYYMKSLGAAFSMQGFFGFALSLFGPRFASSSISFIRRRLGYGEYYE